MFLTLVAAASLCSKACSWLTADEQAEPPAASAKEWADDGSLPVDGEGTLPFYMLDAHEEIGAPGTVYLFGKARHWLHEGYQARQRDETQAHTQLRS